MQAAAAANVAVATAAVAVVVVAADIMITTFQVYMFYLGKLLNGHTQKNSQIFPDARPRGDGHLLPIPHEQRPRLGGRLPGIFFLFLKHGRKIKIMGDPLFQRWASPPPPT